MFRFNNRKPNDWMDLLPKSKKARLLEEVAEEIDNIGPTTAYTIGGTATLAPRYSITTRAGPFHYQ